MTDFVRIPGKVFAENASGVGNNPEIGQFGSAKAGTFVGTDDVRTIQDLEAWSQGWTSAVVSSNNYPPLPEMNGVLKVLSYQMCYLLQHGIPEWSSETTYYTNDYVNYKGALYFSTIDNNTTEPLTPEAGNNWKSGTVDLPLATTTRIGAVQPDGTTISIDELGIITAKTATSSTNGIVRPDNNTITINDNGIITAKTATSSTNGIVRPDNNTITINTQGQLSTNAVNSFQPMTPNYAGRIERAVGTLYTATEPGWIMINGTTPHEEFGLYINSIKVWGGAATGTADKLTLYGVIPIGKGDTYQTYGSVYNIYFVPIKKS